jgi:hypothetical protein
MKRILLACLVFLPALAFAGEGVSTAVTVRALAHDAKLIPGVDIVIADAATGEELARGRTEGGTGDTDRIVREPVERGAPVFATEGAAGFTASLDLAAPRRVEITAVQPETGAAASRTLWLAPGRDLTGNGVVLELYGLDVGFVAPTGGEVVPGEVIPVTAHVEMLCGCPVTPGGLWDADGFTVTAELTDDGAVVDSVTLDYAGETSRFSGRLPMPEPGGYTLRVLAEQPARGNFGVVETDLVVKE